jgi:hypothetical protein
VISGTGEGSNDGGTMSISRRLANDLLTYFKLDADIVPETEMEALETEMETRGDTGTHEGTGTGAGTGAGTGTGNIVVIGGPSGQYIRRCLGKRRTAFTIADQENGLPVLQLRGVPLNGISQGNTMQPRVGFVSHHSWIFYFAGIIFTHPHESSPSSTMLFILANDQSGLERAARLFPIRTGLALVDWMVIGNQADKRGAAGIEKAGYVDISF